MEERIATPDLEARIERELHFFPTEEMKQAFLASRVKPYLLIQSWAYGPDGHGCHVVAMNGAHQLVYCQTGLGKSFPWCCQPQGSRDQGSDGEWCAYLVEAYLRMWGGKPPEGFEFLGPGERESRAAESP